MTWLRTPRAVWAAAGLTVVLGLAWVGWRVWQVQHDLNAAVDHGRGVQAAVEARDADTLTREVAALREASASAAERTSGPTWGLLTKLPVFGDDAEGIEVTSRVLSDLAHDGIEPLVTASERFDEFLPQGGKINVDVARDLASPVAEAEKAFTAADRTLTDVDASGFVGPVNDKFAEFETQVGRAARALRAAKVATRVLPTMLGGDKPQHYLLVFQNNAEIRATGGLPGAATYVEAAHGKLTLRHQVTGASFGESSGPVLPLTQPEQDLYGDVLATHFRDANMTPDFPRAADLMKARWLQVYPEQPVDGILMVDAVSIGYFLDATGPIDVGGVQLTGDNVVDQLLHDVYIRIPEPAQQDVFFADVASQAFAKVTDGVGDPAALLKALSRATDERRVSIHSFHDTEQKELEGTAVEGAFVSDPAVTSPQIGVTFNDTTGAKMSYFLRYDVDVTATSCDAGVQKFSAKAQLRSTAPTNAADLPPYITGGGDYGIAPGSQLVTVRIFAPAGGELGQVELNGEPIEPVRVDQDGRSVGMTYVQLAPGQAVDLAWTLKSGANQTGAADLIVTPSIETKDGARTLASACKGG